MWEAVYWWMSDHDFSTPMLEGTRQSAEMPRIGVALHCPDLPTILGLLAGDSKQPHEGERNIVASAIWRALQSCSPEELPNLSRLVQRFSHDIESRAQLACGKNLSLRGNLDLVPPVLALCAQIHRTGLVDADGMQARSLLFLSLVDLAIHCPELISSTSVKQTANGLRVQLERLGASPKAGVATHHFSVWQLFDWVEANDDLKEYVKLAVRNLRKHFLVAWHAFESFEVSDFQGEDDEGDEDAVCMETTADQTFWLMPESSRFEVELPVELKRNLLAAELTRITAMSRFASGSLLLRSDDAMVATVADLIGQAASQSPDAPHALAKLLSIAGCLPLNRAYEVRWAAPGTFPGTPPYPGVLTPDARWLIHSEFDPRTTKTLLHARCVHIPIPEPLAHLLRGQGAGPNAGDTVIRFQAEDAPSIPREASAWETTIASRLMHDTRFGISLAQHVMHTSFGLDVAPLFYDRIPAWYVAHGIAKVTHPWFGIAPRPHAGGVPTHYIGSQRIAPKDEVCKFLQSLRIGWNSGQELWERIHLRSRNLRYGVLLSVAHRTNARITEITTRWIAGNDLVISIADKEIAIDHPHRLAALGTKVVEELEQYLAELREAARVYPGTPLACAALRIIADEQCLFLCVRSPDDCNVVTLEEHVAADLAWAQDIPNWVRHFLNDELAARLPDPLRVAQMGWTGTRSAISELSVLSVVDVLSRVRPTLDAILKENGWAPLPASGYGRAEHVPVPVCWTQAVRDHERAFRQGLEKLRQSAEDKRRLFAEKVLPAVNALFRANAIALEATSDGLRSLNGSVVMLGRDRQAALLRAMGADRDTQILARELLHLWLSKARRSKLIIGPLPRKIVRAVPRHSSPFLFDAPHSIGHRNMVEEAVHAASLSAVARTFITLMLRGWIADADTIMQLMQPGAVLHELVDQDVLLVEAFCANSSSPTPIGAMAFNGSAAIALRAWHRSGAAHVPDRTALQIELHAAIHHVLAESVSPDETLTELEVLMRSHWGLRAPGIIRDVVLRRVVPSIAPLSRLVALHEDLPIWPEDLEQSSPDGIKAGTIKARRLKAQADYDKVKELLSKLAANWSLAKDEVIRGETITALKLLVPVGGPRSGAHIMALYAAAYLAEGLRKERVRPVTVQDAVYSVGSALIQALPEQADFSRRELWQAAYARALQSCALGDQVRLAKNLAHFQKVMAREYDIPLVNMSPLLDALDLPAPPEPIGFLTRSERQGAVSMAMRRLQALADQGSPQEQQEALCALAITASAFASSLRDREFRVPLLKDWQAGKNEPAQIKLRSNGGDFVKTQAGRRSVALAGEYGSVAIDAINRLAALKGAPSVSRHREKLFSPAVFGVGQGELPDVMRRVNADLRYVTANPLAAIDLTRKTWALAAFRELGTGHFSNWPAIDLLSEIGQAAICTMQAHYLHDSVVFLERVPFERGLPRTVAGWILGMNPKAAQRLLSKSHSWLRPAADTSLVTTGSGLCRLEVETAGVLFEPSITDTGALLFLLAEGQSVQAATSLLAWPRRINVAIDHALAELKNMDVVIGEGDGDGRRILRPPFRVQSDPSLDACRVDAHSWDSMAWIFDQWLADWRVRNQRGVAARPDDWERIIGHDTPVSRLSWMTEEMGHMTLYRLGAKDGKLHSPWPTFHWLAFCTWVRQRIIACPPP